MKRPTPKKRKCGGYIRIIDRKIKFEYYAFDKPDEPRLCLQWENGLYTCKYCEREFKATYIAYSKHWMGRKSCAGIARANYEKHLWACYNKLMRKHKASKQLVDVITNSKFLLLGNNQPCNANVDKGSATIIELTE